MQFIRNLFQYKNRSIYFKIFLHISIPIVLLICLMCTVMSILLNSLYSQKFISNAERYSSTYISLLENTITDCRNISILLATNEDLRYFVANSEQYRINHNDLMNMYGKINIYKMTYKYIDSIYVYSENGDVILNDYTLTSTKSFEDMDWYDTSEDKQTYVKMRLKNNIFPMVISFVTNVNVGGSEGKVVVNCDLGEVNAKWGKSLKMYLLNEHEILYDGEYGKMNKPFSEDNVINKYNPEVKKFSNGTVHIIDEKTIMIQKSEYYDWYYCIVGDMVYDGNQSKTFTIFAPLLIIVAGIILGLAVIYQVLKNVSDPILTLENFIKNPDKINNDEKMSVEIKNITDEIFRVIQSNDKIQGDLESKMIKLKEAQIAALQAQVNPHFLYNTLNNIYLQIVDDFNNLHKSAKMVLMFSRIMRYSANVGTTIVTVAEDMQYTKMYIKLMEIRYPKIIVEFHIDEEINQNDIVKMSLQVILENAYKYAFSEQNGGIIKIDGYCEGECIYFKISDNGDGIDPENLGLIRKNLKNTFASGTRTGIVNLNSRIKLIFGEKYGVTIDSEIGKGTTVLLKFPNIQRGENTWTDGQ